MGILIILSTLFIKQHFVLDIIAAVILVEIIRVLSRKMNDEFIDKCLGLPYVVVDKVVKKYKELMVN